MANQLSSLTSGAISSPFSQLRKLLAGVAPGHARPIELTIGEPREAMPDFIQAKLDEATALYGKYPPIRGSEEARQAISEWLTKRYALSDGIDPDKDVLMLSGSREGLFYACLPAVGRKDVKGQPAILMCNPYYSAYVAGAIAVGAEPVYLNATKATGFLPDLDEVARDEALLARTVALFINSPSNPQGTVADRSYILKALELARTYDFMLFFDECYSEIYTEAAPVGGLEVAASTPERFRNLVIFNSLSKRSNLPGIRSGFCAGDPQFLEAYGEVRNMCAPTVPLPLQHASAAVWRDEAHVERARDAYREKFRIADNVLDSRYGYRRPAGGFCLWLDMSHFGGGDQAAVTLWQRAGVKVIPGSFLAQTGRDGTNPGAEYIRVAMVQDSATIQEALERTISVLR
ncbi:MAG: aminotransferase class I/II-fold pyridoxal phosphate-dependent enzyme [Proteobacteria bacterium]|nr:aminotransferase class I/II-fold pyridoxal phosphate-dependent enzyme [Pseudomonadota bacterium]